MYNSDLVHYSKEMQIMRVIIEIPETYTKSGQEHIFNMLKNYEAIDIVDLNLSDLRNNFTNIKSACTEETPIVFAAPEVVQVSSICPEIKDFISVNNEDFKSLEGCDLIQEIGDIVLRLPDVLTHGFQRKQYH